MTTYIAMSPRRRTEHTTWKEARDALVEHARELAGRAKDPAAKDQFGEIGRTLGICPAPDAPFNLRRHDAWGNEIHFRIVAQEQLFQ